MDPKQTTQFIDGVWDETIVPALTEYIRIPNKSPHFDPDWEAHGHMERAVSLIEGWCRERAIAGLSVEVVRLAGRTPVIYMEIPGTGDETVLLYGHLDKQPEMVGWAADLGPWKPVLKGDRLYGRGGADDGYAAFASLTAIEALQRQGVEHSRCVVLIEACEESGSFDLPFYIDALEARIGQPALVVCLDSGCGNYDQLWMTTSLRGNLCANLRVDILSEGVHSGDASGIVPSSFRIVRELLARIEDAGTGELTVPACHVDIPAKRIEQAGVAATVLGSETFEKFPFKDGAEPVSNEPAQLVLNRTWRPSLSVTGAEGMPNLTDAGNVLLPFTALKLSLRLPPTCDVASANAGLRQALTRAIPYGAEVSYEDDGGAAGWNSPELEPWLERAVDDASRLYFGKGAVAMGEGGTIPFMAMLGDKFPDAQFLITGVLGPGSNAHGPNEFLDIPTGKRVTACVAHVLAELRRETALL